VSSFTLPDNIEWLVLAATGAVNGTGNALNNTITGNDVANILSGGDGKDKILGGGGDDRINGGLQADTLTGGAGNDTFIYNSVQDSMAGTANRDTITDFTTGDRISLQTIDARASSAATNEAFSFIGTAAFGHHEGELRYQALGANTLIQGDVNGDGNADLEVVLTGGHVMHATDFQL
jgi:Ca2+-binding RTX toxin-like protein